MSVFLFCVYAIAPGNPGTLKIHELSQQQVYRLQRYMREQDNELLDVNYSEFRPLRARICSDYFGPGAQLSWIKIRGN